MRSAEARIEYVLKGGGPESYRPTFTFFGFRYARVTIAGKASDRRASRSIPISSAITPDGGVHLGQSAGQPAGREHRLVAALQLHRGADRLPAARRAAGLDRRRAGLCAAPPATCTRARAFSRKYVRDVMADQRADGAIPHVVPDPTRNHEDTIPGFYGSTGWGDAICVIPWRSTTHYGDRGIVEEALPAMVEVDRLRLVDQQWSDRPSAARTGAARGFTFGDWLQPQRRLAAKAAARPSATTPRRRSTSTSPSTLAAEIAAHRRRCRRWPQRMDERAAAVKAAFAREFITPSGRLAYDDQTSYALAILHDLIPAELLPAAKRLLQGDASPAPRAASAPASSARRRCCRRWSRSASRSWPRQSSCRRRCPAGSTR